MCGFRRWIFCGLVLVWAALPNGYRNVAWALGSEEWGLFEKVSYFQIGSSSQYFFQNRPTGLAEIIFAQVEDGYRFTTSLPRIPVETLPEDDLPLPSIRRNGLFASKSFHGSFHFSARVSISDPTSSALSGSWGLMLQDPVGTGVAIRWTQDKSPLGGFLSLEIFDTKGLIYRYPSSLITRATPTVDFMYIRVFYRDSINQLQWEWSENGQTWKAEPPVSLALLSPIEVGLFAESNSRRQKAFLAEFRDVHLLPLESVYGERQITLKKDDTGGEEVSVRLNLYNDSRENQRKVYEEKIFGFFDLIDLPQSPPYEILPPSQESVTTVRWYLSISPGHNTVDYTLHRTSAQTSSMMMFSSGSSEIAVGGETGLPPMVRKEEVLAGTAYRVWQRDPLKIDPEFHYLSLQENGILLIASDSTLVRYDGYRFQSIPLPSGWKGVAKETPDGWLWCADWNSGRLSLIPPDRRTEGHWEFLTEPGGEPVTLVRSQSPQETMDWRYALSSLAHRFHPLSGGRVLVLGEDRLLEYDVRQKASRILLQSSQVNLGRFQHLLVRSNEEICVTGEKGIAVRGGLWKKETVSFEGWEELSIDPYPLQDYAFPVEGPEGSFFVSAAHAQTQRHLVLQCHNAKMEVVYESLYPAIPLSQFTPQDVLLAEVGERGSLAYFTIQNHLGVQYKKKLVFNESHPQQAISLLDTLWMSTEQGLVRAAPSLWRQPSHSRAIQEKVISLGHDKGDAMWLLGENYLYQYQEGPPKKFPLNQQTSAQLRRMRMVDSLPEGHLLLAPRFVDPATPSDIYHPVTQSLQPWSSNKGETPKTDLLSSTAIQSSPNPLLAEDGRVRWRDLQGNTWIGWRKDDDELTVSHPLASRTSPSPHPDREWLQRYKDGKVQALPMRFPGTEVIALVEGDSGLIWVAGESSLFTFNGKQWSTVEGNWGTIMALLQARDGKIWLASSQGVFCFSNGSWISYSREDGLETLKVFSLWEDRQGRIWAGTEQDVYVYNASADRDPPTTLLDHPGNLREYSENREIRLFFQGIDRWDATFPERLFYSYRLNRGNWSSFSSDNQALLTNLAPGGYSLQVRSMDRNGNIDPAPAVHEFRVLPLPIQERPWFVPFLIGTSTAILILALIAWVSRSQLVFLARNLERLVSERTRQLQDTQAHLLRVSEHEQQRIGQDLHDDVVQEFVGIALNTELVLEDLTDKEPKAAEELRKVLSKVDEATLKTRRLARGLAPVNLDRLGLVGAMQSLCQDVSQFYGVQCILRCPEYLSLEEERLRLNVFRMVQEAVHNAIKHAQASRIEVRFQVNARGLQFQIQDNGIGFDPGLHKEGMGLQILRYRAASIHGQLAIASAPEQGTQITCDVPWDSAQNSCSDRNQPYEEQED